MIVHLIDGTYELFRQFYGRKRFEKPETARFGAVVGVLHSVLEMIEQGATHVGVATDHVIESFRNDLWPEYKTGEGIERSLWAQFHPLEQALGAMGIVVWPMVELEADDGLASAAQLSAADPRVQKVCIWANDKDLAQCVRAARVVQVIRRGNQVLDVDGVRKKFGVAPEHIPDFLALVGDAQDGYPGVRGIGRVTAAQLITQHGPLESFRPGCSGRVARTPCSSSGWPRCARTPRSSTTWRSYAGAGRVLTSRAGRRSSETRSCSSGGGTRRARRQRQRRRARRRRPRRVRQRPAVSPVKYSTIAS